MKWQSQWHRSPSSIGIGILVWFVRAQIFGKQNPKATLLLGIGLKIIPKSIRKQIFGKPNPEAMHGPVRELLSPDTNFT